MPHTHASDRTTLTEKWTYDKSARLDGAARRRPDTAGLLEAAAKRHGVEMETTADITRAPECLWKAAYGYHDSGTEAVEQQVGGQARRPPMKRVNEASNDALITCLLLAPGPPPSHNQVDSLYPLR
jgi:hypothetical protein